MRRLVFAMALCLAGVVVAESNLLQSLEKARKDFAQSGLIFAAAEAEARPLADKVRELKAVESPWWWTRFRLRRKLSRLQESLDHLREAKRAYENTRQELFLVLSAMEEDMRSSLNRELAKSGTSRARVQQLFDRKESLDRELEAMGFGEGKPFPLVDDPGQGALPLLRSDRQKALQARAIQLEAWSDTVKEDLRMVSRARQNGALDSIQARAKQRDLEALFKRINAMVRENERLLSSKN